MGKWQLGVALAAGLLVSTAMSAKAEDLLIGVAGPFTGPNAAFGEQMKRGAQLAIDNINKAGGVLGRKLVADFEDDASNSSQGVAAANKLASLKVPFVLGHFNSAVSIPASEVYAEEGILQITPASTNVKLTDRGEKFNNIFRTCGRDDQQGSVAGAYMAKNYKGKAVAVIQDQTTYGKGLADETKKAMNAAGLQEAMYQGITVGDKDFSSLIAKMKQANIEVIYYGGLHTEAGLLIRQAREQGLQAQLISGDGIVSNEFASIAGPASDGVLNTDDPDQRKYPSAKAVVEQFKAQGYDPEGYTLRSYAGIQVFAEAAKRANSIKLADLLKVLHGGSPISTVVGDLSFDAKGDLTKSAYVFYKWKDGNRTEM